RLEQRLAAGVVAVEGGAADAAGCGDLGHVRARAALGEHVRGSVEDGGGGAVVAGRGGCGWHGWLHLVLGHRVSTQDSNVLTSLLACETFTSHNGAKTSNHSASVDSSSFSSEGANHGFTQHPAATRPHPLDPRLRHPRLRPR